MTSNTTGAATSSNKTNCPLCKKCVSWPCFGKHITSIEHRAQLHDEFMKNYGFLKIHTRPTNTSLPYFFDKAGTKISVCFGCKLAGRRGDYADHLSECPHAAAHRAAIKEMCANDLDLSGNPLPKKLSEEEGEELGVLKGKLERLEAKAKRLEKENEELNEQLSNEVDEKEKEVKQMMGISYIESLKLMDAAKHTDEEFMTYKMLLDFYNEHKKGGCAPAAPALPPPPAPEPVVEAPPPPPIKPVVMPVVAPPVPVVAPKPKAPSLAVAPKPKAPSLAVAPIPGDWNDPRNEPKTEEEFEAWLAFKRQKAEEKARKEEALWSALPSHPAAGSQPSILSSTRHRIPPKKALIR